MPRSSFARAVAIAEAIAASPKHDVGRRGLIEAYLQLGRAYSFAREYRGSGDVVPQDARPGLFAGCLKSRVIVRPGTCWPRATGSWAISRSSAKDYEGARQDYLKAIEIGRQVLADEPRSFAFKAHLAIGARRSRGGGTRAGRDLARRGSSTERPSSSVRSSSSRTPRTLNPR